METKNALRKIEQYWQIIRNLHFHIEQEGEISIEEYALIDKYLKVISQKYKGLVRDLPVEENKVFVAIEKEEPKYEVKKEVEDEKEEQQISEPVIPEPVIEVAVTESIEEEEEVTQDESPEEVFSEVAPSKPKKKSISSYLEQMLDSPDSMPAEPVLFSNKGDEAKTPSLNDKLKEMRVASEDLNTKIKRATAEKISLNNKFEFIRELFANNPIEYANAIQYFDMYGMDGWAKVESEYSERFNWINKKGVVNKFKALVTGK